MTAKKKTETPPLDCLAIGAHPDDAELFAGGTLVLLKQAGYRVGILDLTRGESATRGTPETRAQEAHAASELIGLDAREILDLGDGCLHNTPEQRKVLVEALRRLKPRLVLAHGHEDRHPDHRMAHDLVRDGCFLSYVAGFPAEVPRWRVEAVAYFQGNIYAPDQQADWVVDISSVVEKKYAALEAYSTQFKDDDSGELSTYISSRDFWDHIDRRARVWGHRVGVRHGEPFTFDRPAHAAHPLVRMTTGQP